MRHTHVIKPVHGSRLPTLCVTMDVHQAGPGDNPTVALCIGRFHGGRLRASRTETGAWQWAISTLAALCRPGAAIWLVSRNLYPSLVQMHFFDAVDQGIFTIKRDRKKPARPPGTVTVEQIEAAWRGTVAVAATPAGQAAWSGEPSPEDEEYGAGQIVHEPNCCYVIANRAGVGKLTCVDMANYGVRGLPGWSAYPVANAELLMGWWAEWLGWISHNDAGSLRLTLASQAHYCYRKRFMRFPIVVHDNEPALALEQAALHGGRCEAFRIGELPGPIYHVDARSLYGAMAAVHDVPTQLMAHGTRQSLPVGAGAHGIIADVTVSLDVPAVPYRAQLLTGVEVVLPPAGRLGVDIRGQSVPLTIYPTGTFRTTLCGPELAMVREWITEWHAWSVYRMAPALRDFAVWNYNKRVECAANSSAALTAQMKQWSQFCYGKWASRYRGWLSNSKGTAIEPWELWWEWDAEQERAVPHRSVAGRCEVFEDRGLSPGSCPAITAWINSLARVWLEGAITCAGRDNVFYADTDSLFVNGDGLSKLQACGYRLGDGLGDLRLVGEHQSVVIHGWKHYECDGQLTCAGLPISRRGGVIDAVADEAAEPVTIACAAGRPPQEAAPVAKWHRSAKYRHGLVQPDGTVKPHHLEGR